MPSPTDRESTMFLGCSSVHPSVCPITKFVFVISFI